MKEYWTDTILEKIVPAATKVMRGEPVRIYKADEVAELVKPALKFIKKIVEMDWVYRDKESLELIANLEQVTGK